MRQTPIYLLPKANDSVFSRGVGRVGYVRTNNRALTFCPRGLPRKHQFIGAKGDRITQLFFNFMFNLTCPRRRCGCAFSLLFSARRQARRGNYEWRRQSPEWLFLWLFFLCRFFFSSFLHLFRRFFFLDLIIPHRVSKKTDFGVEFRNFQSH